MRYACRTCRDTGRLTDCPRLYGDKGLRMPCPDCTRPGPSPDTVHQALRDLSASLKAMPDWQKGTGHDE